MLTQRIDGTIRNTCRYPLRNLTRGIHIAEDARISKPCQYEQRLV